jgi:hypothetical protein
MVRPNHALRPSGPLQQRLRRIVRIDDLSLRIVSATWLVTSADFGVFQPAGRARADHSADLRVSNEEISA